MGAARVGAAGAVRGGPAGGRAPFVQSRPVGLLLAVLAGALLWAAFPDTGWWPLTVVAVAVLHVALRRDHAGWGFLVALVAGLTFFVPHVWWAYRATALVPWLGLSLLGALGMGAFGAVWTWALRVPFVRRYPGAEVLAFATVWTAVEQWRSSVPWGGFPWGRLAWAAAGAPTGRAAWLGGVPLVSFLLAAAGMLAVLAVTWLVAAVRERPVRGPRVGAAGAAVVVGVVVLLGPAVLPLPTAHGLSEVDNPPVTAVVEGGDRSAFVDAGTSLAQAGVLRVGAVQGNVPAPGAAAVGNADAVLANHLRGTAELAADVATRAEAGGPDPGLDLVLWPEDSSGFDPQVRHDVAEALDDAAAQVGAPILVGAQERPATGGRWNVLLLWPGGEGVTGRYAKQHPAPFGEYIPWRPLFRLFTDQVDRVATDMLAATNAPVIDVPVARLDRDVRLGVAICFEVAYDEILRDATSQGAQVLVVPTNNASFGVSAESTQQLQMTRLQAIANGRAAVQVSTVGVSAVVAPDGTLVARTGLFTADRVNALVPLRTEATPALLAGAWPGWVVSAAGGLLAVAGLGYGVAARRRARGSEQTTQT